MNASATTFHFERRNDSGCWEWRGSLKKGYGRITDSANGETRAHRAMWIECMGPIPDGLTIDHLCHNRACVNPAHMEVVTFEENMRRAVAFKHSGAEYCPTGFHPMTPENTTPEGQCRCCRRNYLRDYQRAWNAKRAALKAAAS